MSRPDPNAEAPDLDALVARLRAAAPAEDWSAVSDVADALAALVAPPTLRFRVAGRPQPWQRVQAGGITIRELDALAKAHGNQSMMQILPKLRQLVGRKAHRESPTYAYEGVVASAALMAMTQAGIRAIPRSHRVRMTLTVRTDTVGGDGDNYTKAVWDGLQPVLLADDRQVAFWEGNIERRVPVDEAGLDVAVWDLGEAP